MTMDIPIEPLPARIRCAACGAETSSTLLHLAPTTMGWLLLEGFWFCADHASAAHWIVQLDRERNAHQVTLLRLDAAHVDAIDGEHADGTACLECEVRMLRKQRTADIAEIEALQAALLRLVQEAATEGGNHG